MRTGLWERTSTRHHHHGIPPRDRLPCVYCLAVLLQERTLLKKLKGVGDGAVDIFFRCAWWRQSNCLAVHC